MKSGRNKNIQLKAGLMILGALILVSAGVYFSGNLSIEIDLESRLENGSQRFPLGTDSLGRDLLSSVLYGVLNSLLIGCSVTVCAVLLGVVLGLASGLAGGVTDSLLMRMVDIILAFPGILLAISLVAFLRGGIFTLIGVLVFSGWPGYARIIRGEVLKYRGMDFVLAARSYNAGFWRIAFFHFPRILLPLIAMQAFMTVGEVILAESSLNFLGIGLGPRVPTLGLLIDSGMGHIFDRPLLLLAPAGALFLLVLSFNLCGDGLRKYFERRNQ